MNRNQIEDYLELIIKNDLVYKMLYNYAEAELNIISLYKVNFYEETYIDLSLNITFVIELNSDKYSYLIQRRRTINKDTNTDYKSICEDIKDEVLNIIYDIEKVRNYIHLHREAQEDMYSLMNKLTKVSQ